MSNTRLYICLLAAILFCTSGCAAKTPKKQTSGWMDLDTMKEKGLSPDFTCDFPESIQGYNPPEREVYIGKDGSIQEAVYVSDMNLLFVKKGHNLKDVLDTCQSCTTSTPYQWGSTQVTMEGNGDLYYTAFWKEGDFAGSVSSRQGLRLEEMETLVTDCLQVL